MDIAALKTTLREKNLGAYSLMFVTVLLCVILTATQDNFLTFQNLHSLLYGVSIQFFAIIGFTYLMIMGEIDLSVGSVYAFSGMFIGYMMMYDVPMVVALPVAIVLCAVIGLVNGLLIVKFRLNSLMITIGMMIFIRGIDFLLAEEMRGSTFKRAFRKLAVIKIGPIFLTVIFMVVIVAVLEFLLRRHTAFKKVYYVGENLKSASVYGMNAPLIKTIMFVVSSVTAGIGGVFAASRVMAANVTTGDKLEFKIVTAAILGGASLFGGKGSILNSALALFFLAVVYDGMVRFDIKAETQLLVIGVILIVAVYIDTVLNKDKTSY
jgi:ribose transport system permease protein